MNILPVIFGLMCYLTIASSQTATKSSDAILDSLNNKGQPTSLSVRSGGNSSISAEEREHLRKIHDDFVRDQEYRDQLLRDEITRREREAEQDRERRKVQEQQNATPVLAVGPTVAVAPATIEAVPVITQRNTVPVNSNGQQTGPVRTQTGVGAVPVAAVPAQNQGGLDLSKILSSGIFSDFLAPKLLGPGDASSKLVPPLVTSSLQQQMQNPNAVQQGQQGMMPSQQPQPSNYYGYPQYPNADPYARQMQFPGMQQQPGMMQQPQNSFLPGFGSAVPSFNGFPQTTQTGFQPQSSMMQPTMMQQFPGMQNTGFGTPMNTRDFPGMSGLGQMNPALYGGNLVPQQASYPTMG